MLWILYKLTHIYFIKMLKNGNNISSSEKYYFQFVWRAIKKKSEHLKQYQHLAVFYLSFPLGVTFNQVFLDITVEIEYSSFISSQKFPPPPKKKMWLEKESMLSQPFYYFLSFFTAPFTCL